MGNRLGSFNSEPSSITPAEYYNLAADVRASIVLVDCRPKEEYDRSHLDGAVHAASDCATEVREHPRVEQWEVLSNTSPPPLMARTPANRTCYSVRGPSLARHLTHTPITLTGSWCSTPTVPRPAQAQDLRQRTS